MTANRAAVANTDVLRVRGVITTPIYDIIETNFPDSDTLNVSETSPWTGDLQELRPPSAASDRAFLIGLQSPLDINSMGGVREYGGFRVVEATNDAAVVPVGPGTDYLPIDFNDTNSGGYAALNPSGTTTVIGSQAYSGGYLDDFIFYVALNGFGEPSLYRLRVDEPGAGPFVAEELVPNVSDFQVALGCDIDVDGDIQGAEWFLSERQPRGADSCPVGRPARGPHLGHQPHPGPGSRLDCLPRHAGERARPHRRALRYRYRIVTVRVALRSHPQLRL